MKTKKSTKRTEIQKKGNCALIRHLTVKLPLVIVVVIAAAAANVLCANQKKTDCVDCCAGVLERGYLIVGPKNNNKKAEKLVFCASQCVCERDQCKRVFPLAVFATVCVRVCVVHWNLLKRERIKVKSNSNK